MKYRLLLLFLFLDALVSYRLGAQLYQGDKMLHIHMGYNGRWHKEEKVNFSFTLDTIGYGKGELQGLRSVTVPVLEAGYAWMISDDWGGGINLGYQSSFLATSGSQEAGDSSSSESASIRLTLETYNVYLSPFVRWYFYNQYKIQSYVVLKLTMGMYVYNLHASLYDSSGERDHIHLPVPLPNFGASLMVGANYFPTEHLGIYLEGGYGKSYVNLGVLYKL